MSLSAKDIMTPHIKSVPENWTLQRFAAFLSENQITGSPVVDGEGVIVGIATLFDIADFHLNHVDARAETHLTQEDQQQVRQLRQMIFEGMASMPVEVRDIMTPQLLAVDEETPVKVVAEMMMKEHVHRVFVKRNDAIVGIITTYDMLQLIAKLPDEI
ncbi:MAG: CBS domain-containing protein [Hahellaceae bacterium]|nr:CBS domain-containing protein [Hahellaceae bacterium]